MTDNLEIPLPTSNVADLICAIQMEFERKNKPKLVVLEADAAAEAGFGGALN